jgi:hypothetical protein
MMRLQMQRGTDEVNAVNNHTWQVEVFTNPGESRREPPSDKWFCTNLFELRKPVGA